MSNIWITSDTHFGHANIIKYCARPFKNLQDMDDTLVENWNSVVKPGDKVYHLGDVYFKNGKSVEYWDHFFTRLHGQKRLVLGNHDDAKDMILHKFFRKIVVWRMMPEFKLLMTHIPVHEVSLGIRIDERHDLAGNEGMVGNEVRQLVNVHGHIHQNNAYSKRYVNVCVEKTDYKPVHIEDVIKSFGSAFR